MHNMASDTLTPPAGQYGPAGQAAAHAGEEEHHQREAQAGSELPAEASLPG